MTDLRMANIEKLTREIEALLSGGGALLSEDGAVIAPPEDLDASWEMRVSDDRLRVYLDMYPAVGEGAPLDPAAICRALDESGIRNVDRERVETLAALCDSGYPTTGEDAMVAHGTPAVAPFEGRIDFLVPMEKSKRVEESDESSVDWKNLWMIPSVREGDVIARIHLPKEGLDGVDVYGLPLSPKSLTLLKLRYGDGVVVTEADGCVEVASARTTGQPSFRDNTLDVLPLLVLQGDVDLSVGDVDFPGSVLVTGSVLEGFSVRAEKDATVHGGVYNARVQSGGDCIVKGGVVGERAELDAGGDARVGIVEYARITTARNIEVFGYALFATLEAGESLYVQGRNRRGIVGGTCVAGESIEALSAGSPMESMTTLEAGRDPVRARMLQELERKKAALEAMKEKIEKAILSIKGTGPEFDLNRLTEPEKEKLFLLVRYHGKMKESVAEIAGRIESEKRTILAERRVVPRIRIRDRAYPNVTLKMWDVLLLLKNQEVYASFSLDREKHFITKGVF